MFLLFVCLFFNNSVSSSICKLPIRSEIYNCTFKNTNKVSIIIIIIIEHILLLTMLTIKILFTINSLKKKLFRQNAIYNSFRLKSTRSFEKKKFL